MVAPAMFTSTAARTRHASHATVAKPARRSGQRQRWQPGQLSELAQPEVLLPDQFFAALRYQPACPGELRLIGAVLEDAIHCFQAYAQAQTARERRLFNAAECWIMQDPTPARPGQTQSFSFEFVCAVLGLDPGYIRGGLRRWQSQTTTTDAPVVQGASRGDR